MQLPSSIRPFFIFPLALLAIVACEKTKQNTTTLVDWVPQNTAFVLQLNNSNELEGALKNNPVLKSLLQDSPLLSDEIMQYDNVGKGTKMISITPYGKEEKAFSVVYKSTLDSSYLDLPTLEYSGQKIFMRKKEKETTYTAFVDGFALHADSKIILENCIRNYQQKARGIAEDAFYTIAKTADENAPLSFHFKGNKTLAFKTILGEMPLFPKIGDSWASVDLQFSPKTVEADGLLRVIDSVGDPVGLLHSSTPKKTVITQAVPSNAESAFLMTIDNVQLLEDKFKKWVLFHNLATLSTDLSALNGIDELGLVQLNQEIGLIFHLRDEASAEANFIPESQQRKYRDIPYYKTSLPRELTLAIVSLGEQVNAKWVAKLDDFLFFGESETGIKALIAAYKDQKTLENTPAFKEFANETLSEKSSLLWVGNNAQLKKNSKKQFWNDLDVEKYPYTAFQGVVENDFMHLHFRIQYNEKELPKATATNVGIISLEQKVATAPQWLKNHRTKQKDIAVQDENNTLYLYANTGTLYWKKQLTGKIQGPIQQVDLYKNGRLQMAFRTEDHFYILDRNGKIVPPFDKKISDELPIQPLAVFDYDQSRNYRFVLAQGNSIQMLDAKGKRVKGFKFTKSDGPLTAAPKHIRIDKKDYIVVQEENKPLKILNRTGTPRVKIKSEFTPSGEAVYSYLKTFTTTDVDGNLIQIDGKGNVVSTPLNLKNGHRIYSTTKSLVTLSENNLTIKGIPVDLPFGQYSAPEIFYLNNIVYVSVTDIEAQKVYLFFSDGRPVPGFPVYGTSAIDLSNADKDNALEFLVQAEEKDVLIYKIK